MMHNISTIYISFYAFKIITILQYILAVLGEEIEKGFDTTDLPLDEYCLEIVVDFDSTDMLSNIENNLSSFQELILKI